MLKCPFDNTAVFCGSVSCTDLGYTYTKDTSGYTLCLVGQTTETCPFDETKYKCTGEATKFEMSCEDLGYTMSGGLGCLAGQTKVTCPTDSTKYKCNGTTPTIDPIVTNKCPTGYFLSSDAAACDCQYGIYNDGTKGTNNATCYRCGTSSECNMSNGGLACIKCNVNSAK
jgi:hypothetical protein